MKKINALFVLLLLLSSFTQNNLRTVKDYLSIPGPIAFNNTSYALSWTAHPSDNYYKQEYLPAGQAAETFTNMLMVEVVTGNIALSEAVKTKIAELEQRKKTDPLVNYQVIKNPSTGEYLLDFIMGESANGKTSIAEWNAYRYIQLTGAKKGILLFSNSKRAYGNAVPAFLTALKTSRPKDITALSAFKTPMPVIKNN